VPDVLERTGVIGATPRKDVFPKPILQQVVVLTRPLLLGAQSAKTFLLVKIALPRPVADGAEARVNQKVRVCCFWFVC
jgi:hypothetical protein